MANTVAATVAAVETAGGRAPGARRGMLRGIEFALAAVILVALVVELVVLFASTVSRAFFGHAIVWAPEVSELALLVLTFVGGAASYARGEHVSVTALVSRCPAAARVVLESFATQLIAVVTIVGGILSVGLIGGDWDVRSPVLDIPEAWGTATMAVGLLCMGLFALRNAAALWVERRGPAAVGLGLLLVPLALILFLSAYYGRSLQSAAITVMLGMFVPLLLVGVPVAFVFLTCALFYVEASGVSVLSAVTLTLSHGSGSFLLLAIPFFIMAGLIMTEGGLSKPLAGFVESLVGRARGGTLQVIVVSTYLFSGVSGSKVADMAAVGTTMKSMVRDHGYESEDMAAVLAASGAMGETVPPSIALLVYASLTSVSVGALFIAGLLPAAVLALCLVALVYVRARRSGKPKEPGAPLGEVLRWGVRSVPALSIPVVLLGGIVLGIATPTEVSSFAVVWGLLVAITFYRQLTPRTLVRLTVDSASLSGMILFLVAAASTFSWTLTIAFVPQEVAEAVSHIEVGWLFFLVSCGTLLVMGCLLEGLPALLVFVPLFTGLLANFGIDPLHYGIVATIAMGIGSVLPPIGVGMYVAAAVSDASVDATARAMVPYIVMLLVGLLLLIFIPELTLIVPDLLDVAD